MEMLRVFMKTMTGLGLLVVFLISAQPIDWNRDGDSMDMRAAAESGCDGFG